MAPAIVAHTTPNPINLVHATRNPCAVRVRVERMAHVGETRSRPNGLFVLPEQNREVRCYVLKKHRVKNGPYPKKERTAEKTPGESPAKTPQE
jgi:hypothetical protein